jgi:hypothetical protein
MKVWLDDRRPPPERSWLWLRTPDEVIKVLELGDVQELSLDHDLGLFSEGRERTGYDVLLWIEEKVATEKFAPPPVISIHSANASAAPKMEQAIEAIHRLAAAPNSRD